MSRRELFGLLRRREEDVVPVRDVAPAPAFSLEGFYARRAPSPSTPTFAPAPAAAPVPASGRAALPEGMVPVVREELCLATRSFCSVCVERCPRGAIVGARPRVVAAMCDGCGRCVAACPAPVLALALVPRETP